MSNKLLGYLSLASPDRAHTHGNELSHFSPFHGPTPAFPPRIQHLLSPRCHTASNTLITFLPRPLASYGTSTSDTSTLRRRVELDALVACTQRVRMSSTYSTQEAPAHTRLAAATLSTRTPLNTAEAEAEEEVEEASGKTLRGDTSCAGMRSRFRGSPASHRL